MARRIFSVDVERISLLSRENAPAVPHAERRFMIRKWKEPIVSADEKRALEAISKKLRQTT